jgi:hypothetical protein
MKQILKIYNKNYLILLRSILLATTIPGAYWFYWNNLYQFIKFYNVLWFVISNTNITKCAFFKNDVIKLRKRYWPAVSQICNRKLLPRRFTSFMLKSIPTVDYDINGSVGYIIFLIKTICGIALDYWGFAHSGIT